MKNDMAKTRHWNTCITFSERIIFILQRDWLPIGALSMKTLVVYYSRSGVTKKVAERVSERIEADLEEITEKKRRSGVLGFLKSGMEAYTERLPAIDEPKHDASQYDLVVIGTPVWAGKMSSPVRSYIAANKDKLKSVAFFATLDGESYQKTLAGLEKYSGKKALSNMSVKSAEVKNETYASKVDNFLGKLR